ncbi:unnamed protein product [Taenia asiatica]|uniref:Ion_trans_2 domain-containing protein n=1 Tax=Taenia asiatica TaxID=60517 RepID=A0A158R9S8_TAEAS|nr:unnamed protein product [Taenia asiatica]
MSTDEDSVQHSGPLPTQATSTTRCSKFKNLHLNRASKVWEDRFLGNSTASHFSRHRTASQVIGKRHSFAGRHMSSRFTSSESIPNNLLKSRSQFGSSLNSFVRESMADDIILEPRLIAREYLRKWFTLDIISSLPLDYVLLAFDNGTEQIAQAGIKPLKRHFLSSVYEYCGKIYWNSEIDSPDVAAGTLECLLAVFHPKPDGFPHRQLGGQMSTSGMLTLENPNSDWFEQYTWALFKALSHMLCIGYGRFPPNSLCEAWMTAISMMAGATCYALVVGHVAALIQSFDVSKRRYRDKVS